MSLKLRPMANDYFFCKLKHTCNRTKFKDFQETNLFCGFWGLFRIWTFLKICAAIFADVFRGFPQFVYNHVVTAAGNMAIPFLHQYFTAHCTLLSPYYFTIDNCCIVKRHCSNSSEFLKGLARVRWQYRCELGSWSGANV